MIAGYCRICGDENETSLYKWWSADDGWRISALCKWCWEDAEYRRPQPEDYAWDRRGVLDGDCVDPDLDPLDVL